MSAVGAERVSRRPAPDAYIVLSVLVVVLVGVPSELIVAPLGAAGTPAQILGISLLLWWAVSRLVPRGPVIEGIGPVKWLLLAFVVGILVSYAHGTGQPLSSEERSSADRSILTLIAWCGITLAVHDGLGSRRRLDRLLKLLSLGVVGIALLGMVQFFLGIDIAHLFSIPGLTSNHAFGDLVQRADFRRVSGTTIHPIEFGVVLSMVLPLLIHFAIHTRGPERAAWWVGTALVAFALPMSVARTAMLGGAVAVAVAFWGWPTRVKLWVLAFIPPGLFAMSVAVPGLLGTIRGLFLNASTDPSTTGRLEDYDAVWFYFTQTPWTGRGIGTFIPSLYRTLDNQYLGSLVETGLVGLLTLIALLGGGGFAALVVRRRLTSAADRNLAISLAAGLAVPFFSFATFDGLAFPMCAGITFLLLGAVGSLWRLDRQRRVPAEAVVLQPARHWVPRTAAVAGATLALLVPFVLWVHAGSTRYVQSATVLVDVPRTAAGNPYLTVGGTDRAASILQYDLVAAAARDGLERANPEADYGVSVGYGSLERDSDVMVSSSQLRLRARSASPEAAAAMMEDLLATTRTELRRIQDLAGVTDARVRLQVVLLNRSPVVSEDGSGKRLAGAALLLLVLVAGAAAAATSRNVRGQRTTAGDQAPRMSTDGEPDPSDGTDQTSLTAASAPVRGTP